MPKLTVNGTRKKILRQESFLRPKSRRLGILILDMKRIRIRDKLKISFVFNALDAKELEIVVNAMEEKKYKPGDAVISQGDEGDNLYVIEVGTLSCSRRFVINLSIKIRS